MFGDEKHGRKAVHVKGVDPAVLHDESAQSLGGFARLDAGQTCGGIRSQHVINVIQTVERKRGGPDTVKDDAVVVQIHLRHTEAGLAGGVAAVFTVKASSAGVIDVFIGQRMLADRAESTVVITALQ